MSRLSDLTEAASSPMAWLGAVLMGAVILSATAEIPDNGLENAIAADLKEAQRQEERELSAYRNASNMCIAEAGPGAFPVFDANGAFTGCRGRWGK